jgi:D-alanyl-D-alanine carboxypeptidase
VGAAEDYQERIELLLASLQIPQELVAGRGLPLFAEAQELVVAEVGSDGLEHRLVPAAADAWRAMRAAALAKGVGLQIVSAFRAVERQTEIVRHKLRRGLTLEEIFAVTAPPGYSEHHSGCAVDVTTAGSQPLEVVFGQTAAFRWLLEHAGEFSFFLSYPKGNSSGFVYEPWHWCYRTETA